MKKFEAAEKAQAKKDGEFMKGADNNIEDPKKAIVVYQECINTALALQGNKLIGLFCVASQRSRRHQQVCHT